MAGGPDNIVSARQKSADDTGTDALRGARDDDRFRCICDLLPPSGYIAFHQSRLLF